MSGEREGVIVLDRERADIGFEFDAESETARLEDGPYQLIGPDSRLTFATNPLVLEQIDFSGLSFYPDPAECELAPGVLNPAVGVATASLRCDDISDARGNGTVQIEGTIMAAGDVLGMRGDIPPSGGRVAVGSTEFELSEARILLDPLGVDPATGRASVPLFTDRNDSGLILEHDPESGTLALVSIVVDDRSADVSEGDCTVARSDIGVLNPRTTAVELAVTCDAVDVPGLGPVAVDGTIVAELISVTDAR